MKQDFVFHHLSKQINELQKQLLELLASRSSEMGMKLSEALCQNAAQEKLKIAFVGQHNAGKSTIISALTENKSIKISTNVETDVPTDYEWNGVYLTDTPGLYAGVKEEHDVLSLRKIKESDLLVYCITSSLFDDMLMRDFVDLAYKESYKSKIFLLINKMSQESGDFSDLVSNYKKTLNTTLKNEGGNFEDFPSAFIDAHDYVEGIEDNDNDLVKYSNFVYFIELLNDYIKEKGLAGRLDTPCRLMIDAIDSEIANTGTELDKQFMTVLRQSEACVRKYQTNTGLHVKDMEDELRGAIMKEANTLIDKIGSEKVGEKECEIVNEKIKSVTEKKIAELEKYLSEQVEEMNNEIQDVLSSDMANFVFSEIHSGKISINAKTIKDFTDFSEKSGKVIKGAQTAAEKAGRMAVTDATGKVTGDLTKVSTISGSQMHNLVTQVGHFFGKSFKPWEAVHIAAKIGKVTKFLGPILSFVPIIFDIYGKLKGDADLKKVQNAKNQTFNQFSSVVSDIISEIQEQYKKLDASIFGSKIKEIANIRNGLIEQNNENSGYVEKLKAVRGKLAKLVMEISKEMM